MENTPTPSPAPAPAPKPAAVAAPTAAPTKPIELAPEGNNCAHCGERMRVYAKFTRSIEYCCPSLKEDPPVLADKYAEWRDLLLQTKVSQSL